MQAHEVEALVAQLQTQIKLKNNNALSGNPNLNTAKQNTKVQEHAMFNWTLEQLKTASDGEFVGPISESVKFNSISTDTRTLEPGALYIAIKGENFDGHDFIEQAVKQGAAAVLVSSDVPTIVPGVEVEDTRIALGQFAKWHRQQMPVETLVAVTGSNGKTSVKTLLNDIFSLAGNTLATQGNLNNDFGVPRTLLNLRPEHKYAVIEMGANHPKEIQYLTALACPDIAIINNAAGAHLEGFGSLQGVINTKGEIFQGLNQFNKKGIAVLNTDSAGYEDWLNILDDLNVNQKMQFGTQSQADIQLQNVNTQPDSEEGITFELVNDGQTHKMQMPILGYHNAMNAAACTAIARAAGLSWELISKAIANFSGVAGRLQKNRIKNGWLIDDSYNANPESVKAGMDALCSLKGEAIVCLGAMAEVGETSDAAHQEVALYAKQLGVKHLFVLGKAAQQMPQAFGEGSAYFEEHEAMANEVTKILEANSHKVINVLVKGSRSAKMERVTQAILK